MFGGVSKEEYERSVKANNELRLKLEKMRLENALLKDQLRAVRNLPPDESELYIFIQLKESVGLEGIMDSPRFSSMGKGRVINGLENLLKKQLIEITEKDGCENYSVKTADMAAYMKKGADTLSPFVKPEPKKKDMDEDNL
jgi:hypothetical protein